MHPQLSQALSIARNLVPIDLVHLTETIHGEEFMTLRVLGTFEQPGLR